MIRFLFTNTFIVLFSIVCAIWSILLSFWDENRKIMHFYAVVPWSRVILWVCGIKLKVNGLDKIIKDRAYIFVSNHMSYFDIFALLAALPVDFKFIMKKELMKIPLFGWAARRALEISIDRKNPREAIRSVNEAAARIKNGISVVIFPEGTRSDGHLLPFKRGGFQLALKSGCDIIPLAIENSQNIVPKKSKRINRGVIYIEIGYPIPVDGYSKRNLEELVGRTRGIIEKMKDRAMKQGQEE
jgi:1-acyl-sn-glycerol-3-phosphate acyltransferase